MRNENFENDLPPPTPRINYSAAPLFLVTHLHISSHTIGFGSNYPLYRKCFALIHHNVRPGELKLNTFKSYVGRECLESKTGVTARVYVLNITRVDYVPPVRSVCGTRVTLVAQRAITQTILRC